ncbi:MAG: hypothetical protein ABSA39_05575 [Edaphobacter sp.]
MIRPASVTGVIRAVTVLLAAFGLAAGNAKADPVTFPPLTTPAPGATVDGCSGCLFDVEGTPAAATGQAIVSWSFFAVNTNPVTPVIFNSAGVVVGVGTTITPTATGLQTDLFGRTQGTSVLAPGDSVGFFYPGKGSIAVTVGSGVPVVGESGFGGLQAGTTQINTSSSVGNRTYSVSYTSNQVQLTTATAPAAGAISDTCQNCLFEYDPVTSQYNGTSLLSWNFFALNTDTVIPVIFNAEGEVIGFGEPDTPTSTGFQSFAYDPQGTTTDVLETGDYLGWYDIDGGPIAFTPTGGQGGTFAAFPSFSLGGNDVTTTAITDRDYSVGFVTSDVASVPEPGYTPIVALCLGCLLFFRSSVLSNRKQTS